MAKAGAPAAAGGGVAGVFGGRGDGWGFLGWAERAGGGGGGGELAFASAAGGGFFRWGPDGVLFA